MKKRSGVYSDPLLTLSLSLFVFTLSGCASMCEQGSSMRGLCNQSQIYDADQPVREEAARKAKEEKDASDRQNQLRAMQEFAKTDSQLNAKRGFVEEDPQLFVGQTSPNCIETNAWPFDILQKIDDHQYEVVANDVGNIAPVRMLLVTKKAIFNTPGHPIGIKVRRTGETRNMKLNNGFAKTYGVYEECGLMPIPKFAPDPSLATRQPILGK